eukprot:CAMPEP_0185833914 /NCGR_PEP_ID=MMETSP1353-20130828/3644_1 /TAXON_ID=1077150 /ORGANISM="Erythrolobus australicus, Strain CCMP3124" /LENGTH=873 /DNA_ID=CAMNT_0028532255 /DNA_START=409 /DNA_END=3030 /DNA_ORIENTATION=+
MNSEPLRPNWSQNAAVQSERQHEPNQNVQPNNGWLPAAPSEEKYTEFEEHVDERGTYYYVHRARNRSQWEAPVGWPLHHDHQWWHSERDPISKKIFWRKHCDKSIISQTDPRLAQSAVLNYERFDADGALGLELSQGSGHLLTSTAADKTPQGTFPSAPAIEHFEQPRVVGAAPGKAGGEAALAPPAEATPSYVAGPAAAAALAQSSSNGAEKYPAQLPQSISGEHANQDSSAIIDSGQMRNVVLIGSSGAGKSSLASFLVTGKSSLSRGETPFTVGHGAESLTAEVESHEVMFHAHKLNVIDAPGLDDTSGSDSTVLTLYRQYLEENASICGVLVVIDSTNPRLSLGLQRIMKLVVDVFGHDASRVLGVALTKLSYESSEVKKREKKELTNESIIASKSDNLQKMGLYVPPPSAWFFIDAEFDADSELERNMALSARETALKWATSNPVVRAECVLQMDLERQTLINSAALDSQSTSECLVKLTRHNLGYAAKLAEVPILRAYTKAGPRVLFTKSRPLKGLEKAAVLRSLRASRVFVEFVADPRDAKAARERASMKQLKEIQFDSLLQWLVQRRVGLLSCDLKRTSSNKAGEAQLPLIVLRLVSLAHFDQSCRMDLLVKDGTIRITTIAFSSGASRVTFRAKAVRGRPLGFECNAELIVKAVKRELFAEGMCTCAEEREIQLLCRGFADEFNKKFAIVTQGNEPLKFYFRLGQRMLSPARVVTYDGTEAFQKDEMVFVEMFVFGKYEKFNSNSGWCAENGQIPDFFSHWTWVHSGGKHLVCDLQGVKGVPGGESLHGSTSYYLFTDPVVMSPEGSFGDTDLGSEGIQDWFVNHKCNELCLKYQLSRPALQAAAPRPVSAFRMYNRLAYKKPY